MSKIIHVRFAHQHWTIDFDGRSYGKHTSRDEAASIAKLWAANAAKQGHSVQVVIHSQDGPGFALLLANPDWASSALLEAYRTAPAMGEVEVA